MMTRTEHTRTFNVSDSSGTTHAIDEYTTYGYSAAGGKDNWYVKDKPKPT